MDHSIEPATRNLQGCFSRERRPILTIHSGDTITGRTLDAGWGLDPFAEDVMAKQIPLAQRSDPVNDMGHCLVGPTAAQGDGEVGGTAIECAMEQVQLRLTMRDDLRLAWPQARTNAGWLTFGFAEDLNTATIIALNAMLDTLMQQLAVSRKEALALASVGVHLHVTQIANRTLGVHALWPNAAFRTAKHSEVQS